MYIVLWKIYYINISLIFFLIYVFILNFKNSVEKYSFMIKYYI